MKILGIESSCDETAAAVIEDGYRMLSNVISSSVNLHAAYGGVVPEIAARSHVEVIIPVVKQALADAGCRWDDIDAIAVTQGPGLIGSLLIGILTARTLAILKNKPLLPINHVVAHTYANFITDTSLPGYQLNAEPRFPLLVLTVSGGHTQLMLYKSHNNYNILGQTKDDAAGEAYDKVAKILGLPFPGGPAIDQASRDGNEQAIKLPKARLDNEYDFSFSGLKTAVLRAAQAQAGKAFDFPSYELTKVLTKHQKDDLAASFQKTAVDTLSDAVEAAVEEFKPESVALAGGVAANRALRSELAERLSLPLLCPDIKLCTDNAAMIASAAFFQPPKPANPYKLAVIPSL
ncbi:MAG TPA: tRNA (adenosine(37)-N6)-threonylcarbamoyltransferase complex transferase subunit TsaD [Candidatus Saccharimonadales bacterium]|nr:tRNA (adenosine(37)-N6)-threonylcarbamoyltransferase complex transferase subunit TsaD [Candidatus Saccharimonadales bacterium]